MTKGNGRMKKIVTLVFVLLTLLTAAASAESYTQADFEWAEAVQDQSTLTLKEQAKYLDIVKQRQRGIALLAMGGADTPFQIASAAQLAELAQYVNAGDATFVSAHYVLTDDVNLSAYGNWTPIGTIRSALCGRFRRAEPRRHGAENRQKPGRISGPFRLCERHGRQTQGAGQKCGGSGRADSGKDRGRRGGRPVRPIHRRLCRAAGKLRDDRRHDSRYVGKHGAKQLCRRHCGPGMWRDSALLCHGQHHRRG